MTRAQATAEVFWTAFRALPPDDKRAVLRRFVTDEVLRRDLVDQATIESRRGERQRPLRAVLRESFKNK